MLVDLADQCFLVLSTDCYSIISHYCLVAFVQWHAVVGSDMFARLDWLRLQQQVFYGDQEQIVIMKNQQASFPQALLSVYTVHSRWMRSAAHRS